MSKIIWMGGNSEAGDNKAVAPPVGHQTMEVDIEERKEMSTGHGSEVDL